MASRNSYLKVPDESEKPSIYQAIQRKQLINLELEARRTRFDFRCLWDLG
jgi:hypothetical protein